MLGIVGSTMLRYVALTCCDNLAGASGEQGWRSGESARLPPMCPGFDLQSKSGREKKTDSDFKEKCASRK